MQRIKTVKQWKAAVIELESKLKMLHSTDKTRFTSFGILMSLKKEQLIIKWLNELKS
jgi:hypothetical protein